MFDGFMIFWGLTLLFFISITGGVVFMSYWIPKKMGYKRFGIIFSSVLISGLILFALYLVFCDALFFKSDVNKLLSKHGIVLRDNFVILENKSDNLWGAYQRFELAISESDKIEIVNSIIASEGFINKTNAFHLPGGLKVEPNSIISANYENNWSFSREIYQTYTEGLSPVHVIINIDKKRDRLIYSRYLP